MQAVERVVDGRDADAFGLHAWANPAQVCESVVGGSGARVDSQEAARSKDAHVRRDRGEHAHAPQTALERDAREAGQGRSCEEATRRPDGGGLEPLGGDDRGLGEGRGRGRLRGFERVGRGRGLGAEIELCAHANERIDDAGDVDLGISRTKSPHERGPFELAQERSAVLAQVGRSSDEGARVVDFACVPGERARDRHAPIDPGDGRLGWRRQGEQANPRARGGGRAKDLRSVWAKDAAGEGRDPRALRATRAARRVPSPPLGAPQDGGERDEREDEPSARSLFLASDHGRGWEGSMRDRATKADWDERDPS